MSAEDFKNPFSSTFRDKLASMEQALETLQQENAELKRLAADIELFNSAGDTIAAESPVCFFEISSNEGGWSPSDVSCDGSDPVIANKYFGYAFNVEYGEDDNGLPCITAVNKTEAIIGYDIISIPSLPSEYPETIQELIPDPLQAGVVVMGRRVAPNLVVFASVKPRLGVVC